MSGYPRSETTTPLRPSKLIGVAVGVVAVILVAIVLISYARPVPALEATPVPLPSAVPGELLATQLPWPSEGSAAMAVAGLGNVGIINGDTPYPLASVTKVMTALVILEEHPLASGAQGPSVTITYDDVVEYLRFAGEDQSVVAIEEGEVLTQRELLEGLLIPSGNNFSTLLARWDAGSVEAFVQKMNARAAELGMTNTHYEDTSGISPLSVGSAADQLILAQAAMRMPVFAEIVRQHETELPVAGVRSTTNLLLGSNGVVGIKTGRTEEAGGCFMIAMEREIAGTPILIVGVVLAQPSIEDAFAASRTLASAVAEGVRPTAVLRHGAPVSSLEAAWGGSTQVTPREDVTVLGWAGMPVQITAELGSTDAPLAQGEEVGALTVIAGDRETTVPLETTEAVSAPGSLWRVFRQ